MTNSTSAWSLKINREVPAILTVMIVLCGCATIKTATPEFYAIEEKRMSAMIENTHDSAELSDWHVKRAGLRVRADNPNLDYGGALKDFTASLNLNPERRDGGNIRDWIALLGRLADIEQDLSGLESQNKALLSKLANIEQVSNGLKSQYQKARQENLSVRQENLSLKSIIARLEKQEMEMRKSIEDLQALELQIEQRRLQLR